MLPVHTHNRFMQQVWCTRQPRSCVQAPMARRQQYRTSARPARRLVAAVAASKEAAQQDPELLKQITNYLYEADCPDGQLVISVLRSELLPKAADLLTDTFVDTKGIQAYRRYVRRNIHTYLEQHHKMPPAAVVLTAVLRTQVPVDAEDALMLQDFQQATAAATNSNTLVSTSTSSSSLSRSSSRAQLSAAVESSSKVDVSSSCSTTQLDSTPQNQHQQSDSDGSSSSSSGNQQVPSQQGLTGMMQSVLQHLSSGLGIQQQQQQSQQQQQQMKTVEHLVGVAEVSFREFTRSSSLTLNPPKKCAYLCNMAVGSDWRRRGVASHLITAVEDMCCLAGEVDMYLHLRLKDSDSAGGLYKKAGFITHKKDWPIIFLLGQDPRFLMKKQLAADRRLVGRVNLPSQVQQQQQGLGDESSGGDGLQQQQQGAAVRRVAPAASPAA